MVKPYNRFVLTILSVIILGLHTLGYIIATYIAKSLVLLVWLSAGFIDMILIIKFVTLIQKLHEFIYTDSLTKLKNRSFFYKKVADEMDKLENNNSFISILLIDIDNFKNINDKYGHIAGDEILKHISLIFKQNVRDNDVVTRWGGDEFIIILPATYLDGALKIGNRIKDTIENYNFSYNNTLLKTTISIGVASTRDKIDLDAFVDLADQALYKAKVTKNSVVILDKSLS